MSVGRALQLSVVLAAAALVAPLTQSEEPTSTGRAAVKVQLSGADETVALERQADGTYRFLLQRTDGSLEPLTPEAFAARVHGEQASRGFWLRLMNITSPLGLAWVALGLAGQVVFAGRMIVQWMASERLKRSVVPDVFWWMSLAGSSMLIAYFVWRKDLVGVLGQSTGWLIYVRNLWLIRAHHGRPSPETDSLPP